MKIVFSSQGWADYLHWQKTDRKLLKRINDEHRLVYKVEGDSVWIAQARYHY